MSTDEQLSNINLTKEPPRKATTVKSTTASQTLTPAWAICLKPLPFWLGAAGFNSEILASLGALMGAWYGLFWWYRLLKQPQQLIGFLKMGGISLSLILSLSWLVSLYVNITKLDQSMAEALRTEIGTTPSYYALAMTYALCLATVLAAIGELTFVKRLEALALTRILSFRSLLLPRLLPLIAGISIIEMLLIFSNVIAYRGYTIENYDLGVIPWYIPMVDILMSLHILLNGLALAQLMLYRQNTRIALVIVLTSCLMVTFIFFTKGRTGFISGVALHFIWLCFFYGKLPKLKILISAAVIVIPLIMTGTVFNNFLRGDDTGVKDINTVGIASSIGSASENYFSDSTARDFESAKTVANLATRPLVAHPLALAMALEPDQKEFMLGENLLSSIIWALPSAFYGDKSNVKQQEELFYQHFPFGTEDTADSVYLYAYMDFAYVGFLIYPFIIAALWLFSLWLSTLTVMPAFVTVIFVSSWITFFSFSMGEGAIGGWFAELRNLTIALFIYIPIIKLLGIMPLKSIRN